MDLHNCVQRCVLNKVNKLESPSVSAPHQVVRLGSLAVEQLDGVTPSFQIDDLAKDRQIRKEESQSCAVLSGGCFKYVVGIEESSEFLSFDSRRHDNDLQVSTLHNQLFQHCAVFIHQLEHFTSYYLPAGVT